MEKCQSCEGKGYVEYEGGIIQIQCRACGGSGKVELQAETLELPENWKDKGECLGGFLNEGTTNGDRQSHKFAGGRDSSKPSKPKAERLEARLAKDMRAYFRQLSDALPWGEIEALYYKKVKQE